jgi:hypothetical protein
MVKLRNGGTGRLKTHFVVLCGIALGLRTFDCAALVVDPLPQWSLDFNGAYALTPQIGNNYGNWIKSGNIVVDTSKGLKLEVADDSSGSFTIFVPAPVLLGMIFETAVQGDGLMTFYGQPGQAPLELSGNYVSSTGSYVTTGNIYGFKLNAGPNSRTIVNVLDFHVIPEPASLAILAFGGLLMTIFDRTSNRGER